MGIIILFLLIYLFVLIFCIFLMGYFNSDAEMFIIAILWPICLPLFIVGLLGFLVYAFGHYIKNKSDKDFIAYIKEDLL